jgi:hypothetical protein
MSSSKDAKEISSLRCLVAVSLIMVCFCSFFFHLALVESDSENVGHDVGVKVGDWVIYGIYGEFADMFRKHWTKVEVIGVDGTNITVWVTGGESPVNETISGDVENGVRYGVGILRTTVPIILAKDLDINTIDGAFVNSLGLPPPRKWDFAWNVSTLIRDYGETSREVNMLNVSYKDDFLEYILEWHEEYYWDKSTGLILEMGYTPYFIINGSRILKENQFILMRISETNLWQTSQPVSSLAAKLAAVGAIPLVLAISAVVIKKKKNTSQVET